MLALKNYSMTVREIVEKDYRAADVFKKFGINYRCREEVSLQRLCITQGIDSDSLREELAEATKDIRVYNGLRFSEWKIDFLLDYITNVHHSYISLVIPDIEAGLTNLCNSNGKRYADLKGILDIFREGAALLLSHNREEEEIIFPYIKQLENAYRRKETYGSLFVKTLRKPLSNIQKDHAKINTLMGRLREKTGNYRIPRSASIDFSIIFHKLQEYDSDFRQHTYLEHHILFPRAEQIEQQLLRL